MSITHLTSISQLDQILAASKGKLSVIDFHATWCGPCHAIAPTFEALSKQYKNVNFLKCDVDAAKDVAGIYNVRAMPTFIFLKGRNKVDEVQGADRSALSAAIQRHSSGSSSTGSAFSGKGQTLAGSSAKTNITEAAKGVIDLDPKVRIFFALIAAYLFLLYIS